MIAAMCDLYMAVLEPLWYDSTSKVEIILWHSMESTWVGDSIGIFNRIGSMFYVSRTHQNWRLNCNAWVFEISHLNSLFLPFRIFSVLFIFLPRVLPAFFLVDSSLLYYCWTFLLWSFSSFIDSSSSLIFWSFIDSSSSLISWLFHCQFVPTCLLTLLLPELTIGISMRGLRANSLTSARA